MTGRIRLTSDAMGIYHQHTQLLNKYNIAQVLQGEAVVTVVRRELRRLFPELKVDQEQILDILRNDVLKREVIECDKAKEAQQKIKKLTNKLAKQNEKAAAQPQTN